MTLALPILAVLLAAPATPTPSWKADALSDDASVRAPVVARMRAKGRPGLYAIQDLVTSQTVPADRARAIRALAELGDPAAEWALFLELRRPEPPVAAAAIRAVTALRLETLGKPVAARVGDPDPDLCAALGQAAAMVPAVAAAARQALANAAPEAQLSGLEVLVAAGLPIPSADAHRLVASPLPAVRLIAAGALEPEAAEPVYEALAVEPGALGDRAALDLAKLGTPVAINALSTMAGKGVATKRAIAGLASTPTGLVALLGLRDQSASLADEIDARFARQPPATADLLAVGQGPQGPAARSALHLLATRADGVRALDGCLRALGDHADRCAAGLAATPEAAETLARALDSVDAHVRAVAAGAIASASEKPKLGTLASLAADPETDVRAAAVLGLGRLGQEGFPLLQALVCDPNDEVRAAAAEQLARQLPAEALATLVARTVEDDAVRPHLLSALVRLPAAAAEQLLFAELRRGKPDERRQAVKQLARFNDPRALDVLMTVASRDPDADTRTVAAQALGN
jgi:HEAT repeat protein